ncbi:hypothetical protein ACFW6V_09235 [Streptomyces sp. NPDC058734]|uniref:hypothetical protein n=1 Tax=Streptomyces sp. NPDC058734 TaxID=3346615 RepID=UPI0036A8B992
MTGSLQYPVTEGGPLPVDMAAIRMAAAILDGSGGLSPLVEPDFDSYQDFVGGLGDGCDPDRLPLLPRLCVEVLGETGTTRTLAGGHQVNAPFFHHGDLVVVGDLDVAAPFVVTGSLTVEGCLADCGPDSVVAVGRDLAARAVYTDGEMSVGGCVMAEVVYGYYNDNTLQAGSIRARLVVEDDHETIADVQADLHFDLHTYQQGYGDDIHRQLRELLVEEVFTREDGDDKEQLDRRVLFALLREGRPVFRVAAP